MRVCLEVNMRVYGLSLASYAFKDTLSTSWVKDHTSGWLHWERGGRTSFVPSFKALSQCFSL